MLCLSILFVLLFYKYTKHGKLVGLKAPIYFLFHMIFYIKDHAIWEQKYFYSFLFNMYNFYFSYFVAFATASSTMLNRIGKIFLPYSSF